MALITGMWGHDSFRLTAMGKLSALQNSLKLLEANGILTLKT